MERERERAYDMMRWEFLQAFCPSLLC